MPPLLCPMTTGRGKPCSATQSAAVSVVGDAFGGGLEGSPLGGAAVADRQDIVPAAVEREAGKPERGQPRRQKSRRTDIEVHRVAVEQQHAAGASAALRLVKRAVERQGIGRDRDEFGAHGEQSGGRRAPVADRKSV